MSQLSLFEENTLEGKIKRSIEVIRLASKMSLKYYDKPVLVCYSGGKDSDVLLDVVKRAGVPFEAIHSLTTVDAPPTVQHIKKVFRELQADGVKADIVYPEFKGERTTMWRLIEQKKLPPTRTVRYCCSVLKETATPNRLVLLGVRRSESSRRAMRKEFEVRGLQIADAIRYDLEHVAENVEISENYGEAFDCQIITRAKGQKDIICNPVVYWTDTDIWEYAEKYHVEMNPLYSLGFRRVGCVGCPLAGVVDREKQFEMFPQYKQSYIKAFDRMMAKGRENGKDYNWNTGEDVFKWWVYGVKENDAEIEGQLTL